MYGLRSPHPTGTPCSPRTGRPRRGGWRSTWSLGGENEEDEGQDEDEDEEETAGKLTLGLDSPITTAPSRPDLSRHVAVVGTRARWSLAMAMTDERISDEKFVEHLENMRARESAWRRDKTPVSHLSSPSDPAVSDTDNSNAAKSDDQPSDNQPAKLSHSLPSLSDPSSVLTWQTARRALLICRELVRTERHYLSALYKLCAKETRTPPPALMLAYLPALVQASEALLARMEQDPSARGVALAFVDSAEVLEAAYVGWCGVVGGFFVDGAERPGPWHRRAASTTEIEDRDAGNASENPARRGVRSWKGIPSVVNINTNVHFPSVQMVCTVEKSGWSVRDLAILPTQRVTRYVLLYRGGYPYYLLCSCHAYCFLVLKSCRFTLANPANIAVSCSSGTRG